MSVEGESEVGGRPAPTRPPNKMVVVVWGSEHLKVMDSLNHLEASLKGGLSCCCFSVVLGLLEYLLGVGYSIVAFLKSHVRDGWWHYPWDFVLVSGARLLSRWTLVGEDGRGRGLRGLWSPLLHLGFVVKTYRTAHGKWAGYGVTALGASGRNSIETIYY